MDMFYILAIAVLLIEFVYIRYLIAQVRYQKSVNELQKDMLRKAYYESDYEKAIKEPHGTE